MKLIPETNDRAGEVRRSFVTQLDPIETFALANTLLAPRGFTLEEGNPGRFQRWNRGQPTASTKSPLINLPHSIRLEIDHGRISYTASMQAGPRQAQAGVLLTAYAESLEALLARRESPDQAARVANLAESNLKRDQNKARAKVGALALAVIGAAIAAGVFLVMWNPGVKKAVMGSSSERAAKSKNHTPPIVTVRRANQPPAQSAVPAPRE